jgi:flavodoxin
MKSLIICQSIHKQNTQRIAQAMSAVLACPVLRPQDADPLAISECDLVGFGSGIYFGSHHRSLIELCAKLLPAGGKKAFIFSTSGAGSKMDKYHHKKLRSLLEGAGYVVVGEWSCKAWDEFGPFKLIGGLNPGHPNDKDFQGAKDFVEKLK